MRAAGANWRAIATPLAFAGGAGALTRFITNRPEEAAAMARGIAGPTTWPKVMLFALVVFALAWAIQRWAQAIRQSEDHGPSPAAAPAPPAAGLLIWGGIAVVLAYGFSLPYLGFPLATVLYIVVWLMLGGIRSAIQILLVPLIGTTALLYLFIKLALMPLDKGAGAIGELTVALYRLLGIY